MFVKDLSERVFGVFSRDIIVAVITFLVTTYLANALGPETFGLWIGVVTLLTICDVIFRLKIDQLIVFYSKEYPFSPQLYKRISLLSFYGLIAGGIFLSTFNVFITEFFNLTGEYFLALIFITLFLSVFGNIVFYIFLAESKYGAYNFVILTQALTRGIIIYVLFQVFERSVYVALIAQLLSWIVVVLFFITHRLLDKTNIPLTRTDELALSNKDILAKGSYIYTSSAVKSMAEQIPRVFAINFLSSAYVGYLGLTQLILTLINRIPSSINTVLFPMLVKESGSELDRSVGIIRVLLVVFIPFILVLEIFLPFFIRNFYGDSFAPAVVYLQILLPFVYAGLPGLILSSYFSAKGEFRILFKINVIAVLGSIASLWFVSLLSLEYAPILALCASFLLLTMASIFYVSKDLSSLEFIPTLEDLQKLVRVGRSLMSKNNDL